MSPEPTASPELPTLVILTTDGSTALATCSTVCCSEVVLAETVICGAEVEPITVEAAFARSKATPPPTPTASVASSADASSTYFARCGRFFGRPVAPPDIPSSGGIGGMPGYG